MSESRFPWRTALLGSLALNLLVVGAVAGAWGAGVRLERETNDGAIVERLPGPRAFLTALPPETRAIMRAKLADSWDQSRETRQAATQARRDAFAAVAQEPYDVARVRAAFERLRAADQTSIAVFQDNIVEAFAELTPEQRREAIEALRSAAPARRQNVMGPLEEGAERPALSPERRENMQERREERRERWRQRREERQRQQPANP